MTTRSFSVVLFVVCCSLVHADGTGDLWESTAEMAIPGGGSFTLPATTFCRPRGEWNEPPAPPGDSECEMSDVHRAGRSITWKVRCTNPSGTGTGRMEFVGADSYRGTMTMSSDEGDMVMNISGRRVGECDPGSRQIGFGGLGKSIDVDQLEKTIADAQAQQTAALEKVCMDGAVAGQSMLFMGPDAVCAEPHHKEAFCAGLLTEKGYENLPAMESVGTVTTDEAIRFCGWEPGALRLEVCDRALEAGSLAFVLEHCPERRDQLCDRPLTADSLAFVREHCPERRDLVCEKALEIEALELLDDRCPVQATAVAQRECAGRKYSAQIGVKYRGFCSRFASYQLKAGGEEAQSTEDENATKKPVDKIKKGLKDLFRR